MIEAKLVFTALSIAAPFTIAPPAPEPPLASLRDPQPFVIDGGLLKLIGPTPLTPTDIGANCAAASMPRNPMMTAMHRNVDANEDKGRFAVNLEAAFM